MKPRQYKDNSGCIFAILLIVMIVGFSLVSYASYKDRYPHGSVWGWLFRKL